MFKTQKTYFFFLWFLVVSTCIYLGIMLSGPLAEFLLKHDGIPENAAGNDGTVQWLISFLLLVGLFMGFGQWLVINTKIKKTYGWILATMIGFSVGGFILGWVFDLPFRTEGYFTTYGKYQMIYEWIGIVGPILGAGMFAGLCQWVSLQKKIAGSLKWSAVMAVSLTIGIVLQLLVGKAGFWVFSMTVGLISGIFAEPLIIRPYIQQQGIAI